MLWQRICGHWVRSVYVCLSACDTDITMKLTSCFLFAIAVNAPHLWRNCDFFCCCSGRISVSFYICGCNVLTAAGSKGGQPWCPRFTVPRDTTHANLGRREPHRCIALGMICTTCAGARNQRNMSPSARRVLCSLEESSVILHCTLFLKGANMQRLPKYVVLP